MGIVKEDTREVRKAKNQWLGEVKEKGKGKLSSIQVYPDFVPMTPYIETRWENYWWKHWLFLPTGGRISG